VAPVVRQSFLKLGKCFGIGGDDDRTEMGIDQQFVALVNTL
jgi:hypothetical protein